MSKKRERIFVLNEPNAPRLNPALANEIGLNESIILLQIEFWISISNNREDGRDWTYQSVRDMKDKMFTFWSISTINRAINSLIDNGYLIEGNYNKRKYDKTRWFALNFEKLSELDSLSVPTHETRVLHNETGSNHNDTHSSQKDTTIPEITTETSTESNNTSSAELTERFEKLWKLYPRKQGKKDALRHYKRAIKEGVTDLEIERGIKAYVREIKITNTKKRFIKHGSAWFNQKGWEDEYLGEDENKNNNKNKVEEVFDDLF